MLGELFGQGARNDDPMSSSRPSSIPRIVHSTKDLIQAGMSARAIQTSVRTGKLRRLRHGYYVKAEDSPKWPADLYRLRVRTAATHAARTTVFSHESAAALHRLPLYGFELSKIHMTIPAPPGGSKPRAGSVRHHLPVRDGDVVEVEGIPTTSVSRTIADLTRTRERDPVVCLADAALHRGLCSLDDLHAELADPPSRFGMPRARLTAQNFTNLSESVAESRSRLAIGDAGLPSPELQRGIRCPSGRRYRVDFFWEAQKVIGECDGFGKYLDDISRHEASDRLRLEKHRENELQSMGFVVVRWSWSDLSNPSEFIPRLATALGSDFRSS